ncbi:MAG: four helix bundle protein [Bacteroidota bacterium]
MSNIIQDKSYAFAIRIVSAYKFLAEKKKEFVLSKQLLRCGTSIGANVEEAEGGISKKDFRAKMSIAYKEARETSYWLRLLKDTNNLSIKFFDSMHADCQELCKILYTIIKNSETSKQ